ncbi:MAG: PLP-dependent aminotransferase family protein [Acidimicrobiales bacterium]
MVKPHALPPLPPSALRSSAIRDLLEQAERPGVLSLAGGLPSAGHFPTGPIAAAVADALGEGSPRPLQYGRTEGLTPLRELLAADADRAVDEVLVTAGSQQALDLLARGLLAPGDGVALADPAYVGALQALRAAGASLHAIPADGEGLDVDALAERLDAGLRIQATYVVSNFDNPTGATLAPDRRRRLAALAERHGFWIIDDDPYGALRWRGEPAVPLAHLTHHAITVRSTSKVLAPGLRVGWMVAPTEVVARCTLLKQAADLHASSLSQEVVLRLLADAPAMAHHLDGLRAAYRAQGDALHAAVLDRFGDQIEVGRPAGGMFLWARLRTADGRLVDADALLRVALERSTAFVPASAFAVEGDHPGWLRLSFATNPPDLLAEAVGRLGDAVDAWGKMAVHRDKGALPWTSPSSPSRTTSAPWASSTPT